MVGLAAGLAYYMAAELGFYLTHDFSPVSTFWAPNAILLGALLLTSMGAWWIILLAALPAHLLAELRADVPLAMVLCWFVSNGAEALIGAAAVRRYTRAPFFLDRLPHVGRFVTRAWLLATLTSSFLDAAFVVINDWGSRGYWPVWQSRFFSHSLAALTVVPFMLAWGAGYAKNAHRAPFQRYVEIAALAVSLLLVSIFVFVLQEAGSQTTPALLYAPLPLLLWATVRFGPRGQTTAVLAVVLLAIVSSRQGRGPFHSQSFEQNALAVQLLFIGVAITLMSLAAALAERKQALAEAYQKSGRLQLTMDVTEHRTAAAVAMVENRILEMIATGAALSDVLRSLVNVVEAEASDMLCSMLLLDPDGIHLHHAAAPSLPATYVNAVDGRAIGPRAGSFGSAMYRRQRVVTTDVLEDRIWKDYRDLATAHGLRACWSTPIISDEGRVLGAFALYYREPRGPTDEEIRLIDVAAQLAAIAIERERAETEMHEQRRTLAHLARVAMLGELSGAIAHELSQPITAVLSNAEAAERLLTSDAPDLQQVRDIVADIIAADRRARDVIEHLRPMLTRGQVQLAPVDVNELVTVSLKLARGDLNAREVSVTKDIDPGMPSVMGDRVQLTQVMLNLIINACDAMSTNLPAERHLVITGRRSAEGGFVDLAIADNGGGIPSGVIDHIFDPFYSSKEHGLGLGLSICRSIVLAHRGRIWAANNESGGATFTVSFPINRHDAA